VPIFESPKARAGVQARLDTTSAQPVHSVAGRYVIREVGGVLCGKQSSQEVSTARQGRSGLVRKRKHVASLALSEA